MPLLLIDLDNTLVDREACFARWAEAFVEEHELSDALPWLVEHDAGGYTPRHLFFERVRARFGVAHSVQELVASFRETFASFMHPPAPAAVTLLQDMRAAGWKVAIVTNGSASQAAKVEAAALTELVDACCISEVEGVAKPHPEIFRRAAARCDSALDGAWMVGDNPEADIAGGVALGLRTVWIHHGRTWSEKDYAPTAIAGDLTEALRLVSSGGRARRGAA
ncbi:MAG: putative hydrolase of the superfamily [Gaiellaceae bacterium]|jgi:putative hydrolase of the HAD superfamily|nr:putative hydrolase of the superfamily [Gaiellaceae bacterium]